jgi:hypothetical protein
VLGRFRTVYEKMNSALDGMPYEELGISDEVMEQVSASSIAVRACHSFSDQVSQFHTYICCCCSRWS